MPSDQALLNIESPHLMRQLGLHRNHIFPELPFIEQIICIVIFDLSPQLYNITHKLGMGRICTPEVISHCVNEYLIAASVPSHILLSSRGLPFLPPHRQKLLRLLISILRVELRLDSQTPSAGAPKLQMELLQDSGCCFSPCVPLVLKIHMCFFVLFCFSERNPSFIHNSPPNPSYHLLDDHGSSALF